MLVCDSERWGEYPLLSPTQETCIDDVSSLRSLLQEKAGVTFVSDPANASLEASLYSKPSTSVERSKVILRSVSELHTLVKTNERIDHDWAFIIAQKGTWGRLKICLQMFQMLCQSFRVHPAFIEIAISFGFKIEEGDEYFTSCYCPIVESPPFSYEIFYNIRYVERHGRSKPLDPWSFRQYAVYHRYNGQSDTSAWILIQPRDTFHQWFTESKSWRNTGCSWGPLRLHMQFLKSSSSSWRWFLNYLSDEVSGVRLKVICQTDPTLSYGSEELGFSQSQSLELIQAKARRAYSAIESTIAVIRALQHHLDETMHLKQDQDLALQGSPLSLQAEAKQLILQLEMHARKAQEVTKNVESINLLIQRILDLRNYRTVHSSNAELRQISASTASESQAMLQLSDESRKDGRVMKVASIIALAYLPAGLVASVFSSGLVSVGSRAVNYPQGIGLFLTLVLTLTVSTVATAFLWVQKDAKYSRKPISKHP